MTTDEERDKVIDNIANLLRHTSFSFEFVVKKKPKGIRIIQEVSQEELNAMMENARKRGENVH